MTLERDRREQLDPVTLHWQDLLVLAITCTLTGLGVTVGYHRLFTHRSFKTTRGVRALLAVLGSMAVEGPLLEWVATHRSTTASQTSPETRTAPTSTMRRDGAARCTGWAMRTSAGCSAARTWPTPTSTPRTCSPTATCA
jgi:fatty-acid desaturase